MQINRNYLSKAGFEPSDKYYVRDNNSPYAWRE